MLSFGSKGWFQLIKIMFGGDLSIYSVKQEEKNLSKYFPKMYPLKDVKITF